MSKKNTPHYPLTEVFQLLDQGRYRITFTAEDNAAIDFNYNTKKIIETVYQLKESEFYKSMEAIKIPGQWQDVYQKKINDEDYAYIKLQIKHQNKAIIIQFKKK